MNSAKLLTLLRAITNDTLKACSVKECNPEWVFRIHNTRLVGINNLVRYDNTISQKMKTLFYKEIHKMSLANTKKKTYDSISKEVLFKQNKIGNKK